MIIKRIDRSEEMKKDDGSSLAIGISLGLVFGLLFDNLAIGLAIGTTLGVTGVFSGKGGKKE